MPTATRSSTTSTAQSTKAATGKTTASKTTRSTASALPHSSLNLNRGAKRKAAVADDEGTTDNADDTRDPQASESRQVPRSKRRATEAPPAKKAARSVSSRKGPQASTTVSASPDVTLPAPVLDDRQQSPQPNENQGPTQPPESDTEHAPARQTSNAAEDSGPRASTSSTAVNERLAELEEENRRLKKYRARWVRDHSEKQATGSEDAEDPIPRPPGERGKNGWNMQDALQLEDDGDTYNEILATTRNAIREVGLDCKLRFDDQDTARLTNCYLQMKNKHPYLSRFKHNWACRELVIGALQNRRKAESAKVRSRVGKTSTKVKPAAKRKGFKPRSTSTNQAQTPEAEDSAAEDEDMMDE
ncbi:hypothetical protein FRC01_000473 [Tulasnella sp. 417]|nr:hypothetical protein FRC01_000473 [Tulasnella sp. 417]